MPTIRPRSRPSLIAAALLCVPVPAAAAQDPVLNPPLQQDPTVASRRAAPVEAAPPYEPGRINNRVGNRIQSRINNRIRPDGSLQSNVLSSFDIAEDQVRRAGRPARR